MTAIIDYGLGNVKAFANIYKELNVPHVIARSSVELKGVARVILPGVGAFDQTMKRLNESGMREPLDEIVLDKKIPVLGVCVGMQMLGAFSEEGTLPGLGWLNATVLKFRQPTDAPSMQIPHMGWNLVLPVRAEGLLKNLPDDSRFYFLHSFYMHCGEPEDVLATTSYGGNFACAVNRGNIYGVQFHPEKSHLCGIQLLKNFSELERC
jgi:glutamine amidotransferase